jgi:hypothetical protein
VPRNQPLGATGQVLNLLEPNGVHDQELGDSAVLPVAGHDASTPGPHARFAGAYSTVTVFARLRGWSTFRPRRRAIRYASSWSGTTASTAWRNAGVFGT